MGAIAGLPVFAVVAAAPMLFVEGLVEVFKSTIWTLAYRELRAVEAVEKEPVRRPDAGTVQAVPAT